MHPDSRKATFLSTFLKTQQSYLVGLDVKKKENNGMIRNVFLGTKSFCFLICYILRVYRAERKACYSKFRNGHRLDLPTYTSLKPMCNFVYR
jgi:hypothetical protein